MHVLAQVDHARFLSICQWYQHRTTRKILQTNPLNVQDSVDYTVHYIVGM